jgi:hypothetical protein
MEEKENRYGVEGKHPTLPSSKRKKPMDSVA